VRVAFQSVLNSEVWWPSPDARLGVAARPMSRGLRSTNTKDDDEAQEIRHDDDDSHGYRGRMYTLVVREKGATGGSDKVGAKRRRAGGPPRDNAVFAVDASVVHAWRDEDDAEAKQGVRAKRPIALREAVVVVPPLPAEDSFEHVHVRGDLRVDGRIYGQLATEPQRADYAEFFYWEDELLDHEEEEETCDDQDDEEAPRAPVRPPPGSVVRLQSPEQTLTLDTDGPGPTLIVSTKPAIAAGVPRDPKLAARGALVGFLGQVPVRCRGKVECGDQLIPSGRNDGTAVSLEEVIGTDSLRYDALGIAMEAANPPSNKKECVVQSDDFETTVLCFVRWNDAVRREVGTELDRAMTAANATYARILVDAITCFSVALIVVDVNLLVCVVFSLLRDHLISHSMQSETFRFFTATTGFVCFCLIILLFVAFKNRPAERKRAHGLIGFWIGYVVLAITFAALLASPAKTSQDDPSPIQLKAMLAFVIWKTYSIIYNGYVCVVMAQFRSTRLYGCNCIPPLFNRPSFAKKEATTLDASTSSSSSASSSRRIRKQASRRARSLAPLTAPPLRA